MLFCLEKKHGKILIDFHQNIQQKIVNLYNYYEDIKFSVKFKDRKGKLL